MKKNGFTLAEVLVALGLIGVLSAMTVPTLVKNNQNQIFANSHKKYFCQDSKQCL